LITIYFNLFFHSQLFPTYGDKTPQTTTYRSLTVLTATL